jgi:hypothetical protein
MDFHTGGLPDESAQESSTAQNYYLQCFGVELIGVTTSTAMF